MKKILILLILIYKKHISPLLVRLFGGGCRYYPTCSTYAMTSIEEYGIFKGTYLSVKRFLRCNSFTEGDYYDPVPGRFNLN